MELSIRFHTRILVPISHDRPMNRICLKVNNLGRIMTNLFNHSGNISLNAEDKELGAQFNRLKLFAYLQSNSFGLILA
jgi:hypothetical protein